MILDFELTGVDKILDNYQKLVQGLRDRGMKKAMDATISPIHRAAVARVSVNLGILKGAIQKKVTSKGSKGERVIGIVGIRRGIKVPVRMVKRGANKGRVMIAIPTRYAHLVEFGHRIVMHKIWEVNPKSKHGRLREIKGAAVGSVIGQAPARPFMRPAWDQYGGTVALKTFLVELDKEFQIEASKLSVARP